MPFFRKGHKPRPRHQPGVMNRLEAEYAMMLEAMKRADQIFDWRFEAVKLKLADRTYFTCDFLVISEHVELHEIKARMKSGKVLCEDDAAVKIKVAAELFPWFRFKMASRGNDGWRIDIYESTLKTGEGMKCKRPFDNIIDGIGMPEGFEKSTERANE